MPLYSCGIASPSAARARDTLAASDPHAPKTPPVTLLMERPSCEGTTVKINPFGQPGRILRNPVASIKEMMWGGVGAGFRVQSRSADKEATRYGSVGHHLVPVGTRLGLSRHHPVDGDGEFRLADPERDRHPARRVLGGARALQFCRGRGRGHPWQLSRRHRHLFGGPMAGPAVVAPLRKICVLSGGQGAQSRALARAV